MSQKIFFLRHQHGGVLYDYPFTAPPSPEQIAPVAALMRATLGTHSPKTGESLWMRVVEAQMLQPGEVPVVRLPGDPSAAVSAAEMGDVTVSGIGTVGSPGGAP